jgi:hypothetical protein
MYTIEIRETCGVHSITTHHFYLHHISIIHHLLHSLPFYHFSTERSTKGAAIYLSTKQNNHQEMERPFGYLVGLAGPTTMPADLLLSPYKIPCKPTARGIQANQRTYSKSEIPVENLKLEFSLFE